MTRLASVAELEAFRTKLQAQQDHVTPTVTLCGGTGCTAFGSAKVREAFENYRKEKRLEGEFRIKMTGCHGFCEKGPVVVILPAGIFYVSVQPEYVPRIVEETLLGGKVIEEYLYTDPVTGKRVVREHDVPFYARQKRLVLRGNGRLDPCDIQDYLIFGGYASLVKALTQMTPEQVIDAVIKSGLRGRGGAGFPTGLKWKFAREAKGSPKYIICNADEGDPGAFMDRSVMEGNPHSVIEGMAIAGYAIGAAYGIVYVRAEYPLAVKNVGKAIEDAEAMGLLGENILGTGVNFHVVIKMGAGAFVCGEETAMIASIEGKRGNPRPRPPFPAQKGLWGKPTTINNVETLANIPLIIEKGWEWFASLGTEKSKGTKIFALAGKVNNTGLVEVPMGATLRDIVFDIGGGIPRGRKFKAAQTGGPSGGCVPATYLDLPLDYESLKQIGAIMGSGGLIVMDDGTCMVDMARYFLDFTQKESCGKCSPCRIGTRRMLEILMRICNGQGREGDIETLQEVANTVKEASLCALGKTAPNPVLSTIRYFREEYEEHIRFKHCRAAVCEALVESPCQHRCPAHVNVPQYVALVGMKKYDRALELIRRRNPFASVCGRVCNHPCELLCRRGELDEPIAIMNLKRVATNYSKRLRGNVRALKASPTGKKVAIIGAGPAGLSAGYFLALMGHKVTVYERHHKPGGMLVEGIPTYRLPRQALENDIDYIKSAGVRIKTSTPVVDEAAFEKLRKQYDAIFIAVGTQMGMTLGIPGEQNEGVIDGLTYLRHVHLDHPPNIGRYVVVVGGGNVAVDAARVALRSGAEKVTILYRRSREEMPAEPEEVKQAEQEGVHLEFLAAPTGVVGDNGRIRAVECVRMKLGPADETGRRRPVPIEGSRFTLPADTLIQAIGQSASIEFCNPNKVKKNEWGLLEVDPCTMQTSVEGVFAGGDCVHGAATVVEAVGAGQRAAIAIDKYLGGKGELPPNSDPLVANLKPRHEEGLEPRPRAKTPHRDPLQRIKDFGEVTLCYEKDVATQEAKRCLRCDLEERERSGD